MSPGRSTTPSTGPVQGLQAVQHQRDAARCTVAIAVGLRQPEALALRCVDVDLDLDAGTSGVREAGVREVRPHDGRHTAPTLLPSEGAHPRVVMEPLGHSHVRTTTDTSSHATPAWAGGAAERMGAALWR